MLGFKRFFNARRVLAGIELVHKIIKGQLKRRVARAPLVDLAPENSVVGCGNGLLTTSSFVFVTGRTSGFHLANSE